MARLTVAILPSQALRCTDPILPAAIPSPPPPFCGGTRLRGRQRLGPRHARGTDAPKWHPAAANLPHLERGRGRASAARKRQSDESAGPQPSAQARSQPLVVWLRMPLVATRGARGWRHYDVVRRVHPGRHRRRQTAELGFHSVRVRYGPAAAGSGAGRRLLHASALTRVRWGSGSTTAQAGLWAAELFLRPASTAPGCGGSRVECCFVPPAAS